MKDSTIAPAQRSSFIFSLIILTALPGLAVPSISSASAGVDQWVTDQLQAQGSAQFIVRLEEKARLQDLRHVPNVLQRRTAIVDRLQQTARTSQSDLKKRLDRLGVNYRSFWITNAILVEGDLDLLQELRQRGEVAHIHANPKVALDFPTASSTPIDSPDAIEWNIALIGAPDVWSQGFNGAGAVVGGQDTGYQWDHPAIRDQYRGWNGATADHNYNWHDSIHSSTGPCGSDSPEPCDDNNHGTHTMGTMVGDDGGSNQIGVAPGAKWIGCRNMDSGNGTPATYMECFQWFIAPTDVNGQNADPAMAPHVINNSWSCPPAEGCTDPNIMLDVVNNVVAAGIMVVVSAGNSGSACSTVSTPSAIYEASFSVGATNSSDVIAGFSSRGPVTVDGSNRLKPEISAPGVSVRSSVVGGGYSSFNGTSMAGPHVAGLVALMISADPALAGDLATIRGRIQTNAVQLTTTQVCGGVPGSAIPNNTYGYGRIDAAATVMENLGEIYFDHSFETSPP